MNVAVVIPSFNEEAYIEACVMSVVNNSYVDGNFDIYVVDGRSTDETRIIVAGIASKHKNVHLVDNPKKVTPVALNLGLMSSDADVKIILGAHSVVANDFISANVQVLKDYPEAGCAGGVIQNVYETKSAETIGLAMSSSFGVGNASFRTGAKNGFVETVAFGAYRQSVFDKIGYFDEQLVRNQDDEFNFRLISSGFKIYLSNAIGVDYFVRSSFSKLRKQYYQYGYWKVYVNKKLRTITTLRQLFPAAFVAFLVFGILLSWINYVIPILLLSTIGLYALCALFFASKKARSFRQLILVCATFFILHFFYGAGYLVGIFNFILLGKKPSKRQAEVTR